MKPFRHIGNKNYDAVVAELEEGAVEALSASTGGVSSQRLVQAISACTSIRRVRVLMLWADEAGEVIRAALRNPGLEELHVETGPVLTALQRVYEETGVLPRTLNFEYERLRRSGLGLLDVASSGGVLSATNTLTRALTLTCKLGELERMLDHKTLLDACHTLELYLDCDMTPILPAARAILARNDQLRYLVLRTGNCPDNDIEAEDLAIAVGNSNLISCEMTLSSSYSAAFFAERVLECNRRIVWLEIQTQADRAPPGNLAAVNHYAHERCHEATMEFLAVHRFRQSPLSVFPLDVARLIAHHLWETRVQDPWYERRYEPEFKRRKF
jgi:hypothetical protein